MNILNDTQIRQKVKRLAFEIIEQNLDVRELWLLGINNNGFAFAQILLKELEKIEEHNIKFMLGQIRLNPASPLKDDISLNVDARLVKNKVVVVVDDVANTGRTLFYALKPFMDIVPKKLEMAVLIDRQHKSFPISINYVGLSLATTVMDHIKVGLEAEKPYNVFMV